MFVLFISELNFYLTKEVQPELFVDISRGQIKMKINMNLTFHNLPCACKYPQMNNLIFFSIFKEVLHITHTNIFICFV